MNSQNRMNAGAEYMLYRIWAALLEPDGIHPESLLTCVGALAGYSCQAYVRQTAALPGADPRKYALRALEARDGTPYFEGDALNLPLIESPMSVWALVSRALLKLDEPLPDINGIREHVTQTVGTGAFGVPRVPEGCDPRHPAIVYLKQVWPQALPIAQRFCRKPAQIPVLFGIALQRAIEQTKDTLSPTLSASIAMECAVAMSKVAVPDSYANPAVTDTAAITAEMKILPMPLVTPARRTDAELTSSRASRARKRRIAAGAETESSALGIGALIARVPRAARIVAMVSLPIIAFAGVMYESDRTEPREVARVARQLVGDRLPEGTSDGTPALEQAPPSADVIQEADASPEPQPPPEEVAAPSAPAAASPDDWLNEESRLQAQSNSDGSSEMLMNSDPGSN